MRRLLALGLCLAAPASAGAQTSALAVRVDEATLRAVQPVLDAAARDSLPVSALEAKVLEGVAKRRPAAQIGTVVAELADELRTARTALRAAFPQRSLADGEVVAVAMATRQGVGPDVIRALWEASPGGASLEIPITVLSELVRRGVPVGEASSAMAYVVGSGVPLQTTALIPGRVDGAMMSGVTPTAALEAALSALTIRGPEGRGRGRAPR